MVTPPAAISQAPEAAPLRMGPGLSPGDTVALFSPSSHSGRDGETHLSAAREILTGWGLNLEPHAEAQARHLYLAGTDAQRAEDFQRLYCDPDIKALFATRGGYGAARMLPHLDGGRIGAAAPKAVVGMSDVVALFAYLHTVAGVGSYHGPCLAAPASYGSPYQAQNLADLHALLFDPATTPAYPCTLLHAGAGGAAPVQGRLVGGNLAVLAAGMGTPWALDTAGSILFLEEINEAPYRIDRYVTQLRESGRLSDVSAVVLGHLQGCDGEPPGLLGDVLRDLFADAPYPVAMGLPAGHGAHNRTLPLGRTARLQCTAAETESPATLQVL